MAISPEGYDVIKPERSDEPEIEIDPCKLRFRIGEPGIILGSRVG